MLILFCKLSQMKYLWLDNKHINFTGVLLHTYITTSDWNDEICLRNAWLIWFLSLAYLLNLVINYNLSFMIEIKNMSN